MRWPSEKEPPQIVSIPHQTLITPARSHLDDLPFNFALLDSVEVSLEYIIADHRTLRPRSIASAVLRGLNHHPKGVDKSISISNTLTQHSLRFSTLTPQGNFYKLEAAFADSIQATNKELEKYGALLLSGGTHPFLDPDSEGELYATGSRNPLRKLVSQLDYHRHTWINTQTTTLRIGYDSESEFVFLHNAIALLLPLIPALSASSPYLNGDWQECLDTRTFNQPNRAKQIPIIVGDYVSEPITSLEEYRKTVLDPISEFTSQSLGDFPSEEIEKINCRAIASLSNEKRIEVRIMGTQEAPTMDLAIIAFILSALKLLLRRQTGITTDATARSSARERKEQLRLICKRGFDCPIELVEIPAAFGFGNLPISAQSFWKALFDEIIEYQPFEYGFDSIQQLLAEGSLAQRLVHRYGTNLDNYKMKDMLFTLTKAIANNEILARK
ncbi:MAG: carboxylate-amine ligase [Candidatus Pelagisphaera sp.]|jgi:carboxylate-amine ligase